MNTRRIGRGTAFALLCVAGQAAGQAPAVTVPAGYDPPGAWPARLSGGIFNVTNVAVPQEPDQSGEDNMFFSVAGGGPYVWTASRNNGGDFGLNISPFDTEPSSFPPLPANNFQAGSGTWPVDGTVYAWRPSFRKGIAFCTARSNGAAGQFVYNGQAFTLNYTASAGNQSAAHGYSTNTGLHTIPGGADAAGIDWLLGCAGIPDRQEAVGNFASAFFPFEEGWIGGHTVPHTGEWQEGAASPGLPASVFFFWTTFGSVRVELPGVNSATDGMLLANSTHDSSTLHIIGAHPSGGGWTVFLRDDEDTDTSGLSPAANGDYRFSFVYVPYTTCRLIGGEINGATGATIHGAGGYTMTRLSAGRYGLSIPGETDTSGMLVLTGSGLMAGTADLPDRTFFSYQYDAANSRFVIESREVVAGGVPFGNSVPLRDSNFYFAWVDFGNPMSAGPCVCYANCDGSTVAPVLNVGDFTCFLQRFAAGESYANCDGSTIPPVLNVGDFTCFLQRFAAGCP
jgi:hypothetical protein